MPNEKHDRARYCSSLTKPLHPLEFSWIHTGNSESSRKRENLFKILLMKFWTLNFVWLLLHCKPIQRLQKAFSLRQNIPKLILIDTLP